MKIRVGYEKRDRARFLSHLDVARVMRMALKRANWPVKMSEGFSPKPRVAFYAPLPVGTAGYDEFFDVMLSSEETDLRELARTLAGSMFPGFGLKGILPLSDGEPSMEPRITGSIYHIDVGQVDAAALEKAIAAFMDLERAPFIVERGKSSKEVNLKEYCRSLSLVSVDPAVVLEMDIAHYEGRTVRPQWILSYMTQVGASIDPSEAICDRIKLML